MARAVYVHIPFCRSKCPYCDFASIPADDSLDAYLDALTEEVRQRSAEIGTLYVGGGTPSILNEDQISRLFTQLQDSFCLSPCAEVTMEANPCSLTPSRMDAFAHAGVNRVSLGAQSFLDRELRALGRAHSAAQIDSAVSIIRRSGIKNLSLDLIFGIPGQTPESLKISLQKALDFRPEHISAYCLTFEPATPFFSLLNQGKLQKKTEDEELELYTLARETLLLAGYEHYEISNFALPGRRSAHNMVYWSNEEYIGLGAGAVSYLDGKRITNVRQPAAYIQLMKQRGSAVHESEDIPPRMQAIETMIQRLRLKEGIDCSSFKRRFGIHPSELFNGSFSALVGAGLLQYKDEVIFSTPDGWRLANEVALRLLP